MNYEKIKLTYNISTWPKLNLNFWGITKAGNTSIKYMLHDLSGNTMQPDDNKNQWVHNIRNTLYITPELAKLNGFTNISVTRNPYDRFLSMFKDVQRRGQLMGLPHCKSMEEFANFLLSTPDDKRNIHFRSQTYFLKGDDIITIDIQNTKELSRFFKCDIPHKNAINTELDLSAELRNTVYEIFKNDFERMGYDK